MKNDAVKRFQRSRPSGKHLSDLLPAFVQKVSANYQDRPELIIASWPEIIGQKFASMTKAISFEEGILLVKVNNSTLYSLLSQHERHRLLKSLREKFPHITIRNIQFRIG